MKITFRTLILFFGFLGLSITNASYASKGGESADRARVVSLTVGDLNIIYDKPIANYKLAAVKDGVYQIIPSQIDEYTVSGYVYMKDLTKLHKKDPLWGKPDIFDGKDEMLFMMRDAGFRKNKRMQMDGETIAEISVTTYEGKKRYVYLVEGSLQEADDYYVRLSAEQGRVQSEYYDLKVDPDNAFLWEEFYYETFNGTHPRRPIDTIKLRMKSYAFGAAPITVNNKHIVAKAISEKSGPIRSTIEYKVTLNYLRVPLVNLHLQIVHHEQELRYDSRISVPALRRRLVRAPSMKISIDGYDLKGAEIYASNGPDEPSIVDGSISEVEERLRAAPLKAEDENWNFMDTKAGLMVFVDYQVTAEEGVPLAMMYEDVESDKKIKPEYFPGQLPNVGFEITKIPLKGEMRVIANIHMFNEALDVPIRTFAEYVLNRPKVTVNKL